MLGKWVSDHLQLQRSSVLIGIKWVCAFKWSTDILWLFWWNGFASTFMYWFRHQNWTDTLGRPSRWINAVSAIEAQIANTLRTISIRYRSARPKIVISISNPRVFDIWGISFHIYDGKCIYLESDVYREMMPVSWLPVQRTTLLVTILCPYQNRFPVIVLSHRRRCIRRLFPPKAYNRNVIGHLWADIWLPFFGVRICSVLWFCLLMTNRVLLNLMMTWRNCI